MKHRPDCAVVSARFQPMHIGHEAAIRAALDAADRAVVLVEGSNSPRSINNPLSYSERLDLIGRVFGKEILEGRLCVAPFPDRGYNHAALEVAAIHAFKAAAHREPGQASVACVTDGSTAPWVLRLGNMEPVRIPEWSGMPDILLGQLLCSRDGFWENAFSYPCRQWLEEFRQSENGFRLGEEAADAVQKRKTYGRGPFLTADALCVQNGKVLLVKRRNPPFKGMLAIPGGILDAGETLRSAAVRELKEETRISDSRGEMPLAVLASFIRNGNGQVFDSPWRDPRGHYVASVFHFAFPDQAEEYRVIGADDAERAEWTRLADLRPEALAFDHFAILNAVIGLPYPEESDMMAATGATA